MDMNDREVEHQSPPTTGGLRAVTVLPVPGSSIFFYTAKFRILKNSHKA